MRDSIQRIMEAAESEARRVKCETQNVNSAALCLRSEPRQGVLQAGCQ